MVLIRILLILLLLGAGTFLVWQNQGLFAVTLLGTKMQLLPLGVLLLLSILLGMAMGILLLFLLRRKTSASAKAFRRSSTRQTKRKTKTQNPFTSLFQKNPFQSNRSQSKKPQSKKTRSASAYSAQHKTSDWYDVPAEDWTGTPTNRFANEYAARPPKESYRDEDRDPYPSRSNTDHDDSPDFFGRSRKDSPRERVVDADYRVLRQPNAPPPSDADWDDEFFEDNR
jgi:uncharacterized integral membrane protein